MTSKERVYNRLCGKEVDRIPNFSILMGFAAKYANISMEEFCGDYKKLTASVLKATKDFKIDVLSAMSDPYRETAGFGAEIELRKDANPVCLRHFIESPADVAKLQTFDPALRERTNDRIMAVSEFKRLAGDEYPILGWVEGALAEAADLAGLSELAFMFYDEPEAVEQILEICTEEAILFAKAQIEAGADIIGVGDAVVSVLGPEIYKQFGFSYEKRIMEEIKKMGAVPRLHICGNITPELSDIANVGADIVDIDYMVSLREAKEKLKKVAICGNYDPVTVVLEGDGQKIADAVSLSAKDGGDNSFNMAGCEIPIDTPHKNLLAVYETLSNL